MLRVGKSRGEGARGGRKKEEDEAEEEEEEEGIQASATRMGYCGV